MLKMMRLKMQAKKLINPELNIAIDEYKKSLKLLQENSEDKFLKIRVAYNKCIIKSLILKVFWIH
jgi:hypothetical protein